jgi:ribosome-associated protein
MENYLLKKIIKGIKKVKAKNITILDLRNNKYAICDYFVICNGDSYRQVSSICFSIEKIIKKELRENPFHIEGLKNAKWILIDYITIVVHIFQSKIRKYYNIEKLWKNSKILYCD